MKIFRSSGGMLCALAAVMLAGCAGGDVARIRTDRLIMRPPGSQALLVRNFNTANTIVVGDKADKPGVADSQRDKVRNYISAALVSGLRGEGFNAMAFIEGAAAPAGALVVDGIVREINNGSGAARFMVGMGAGAASVAATVRLYLVAAPNDILAEFDVTGSSKGQGSWGDMTKMNSDNLAKAIVKGYFLKKPLGGPAK